MDTFQPPLLGTLIPPFTRTLKSHVKIALVRYWKNHRIRAIFFVNMLVLWLRKVYDHHLNQVPKKKREYGFDELLQRLKRVEYVEVVRPGEEAGSEQGITTEGQVQNQSVQEEGRANPRLQPWMADRSACCDWKPKWQT